MPAIPGTITSRSAWSELKIAPNSARNSSGSRKLKNAALGLRQNIVRSSRYWRHESAAKLRDVAWLLIGRQLVQQRRRIVRLALVEQAGAVAPCDQVAVALGPVRAQLARRALDEDPA